MVKVSKKKISELKKKKKVPILVGGTGLYFKALTEGLVEFPNIPYRFRQKIRILQKKLGSKKFYLRLVKEDPLVIDNIDPSDTQRIIRAYEIKLFTKKSMYEWFKNTKSDYEKEDFLKLYIDFPRNELLVRIKERVLEMLKNGAINEVEKFIKFKVPAGKSANKAIGVAEIKEFINKKIQIEDLIEKISIKTRQYAKRQSTWGRGNMSDWNKISPNNQNNFLKKI